MSGKEGQIELQQHLLSAYSILKDVLLGDPNNRAEAKTWLISTVAHLQHVPAEVKFTCFNPFSLRHGDSSYRSSARSRGSRSRDRLDDRYSEEPHHYHSSIRSRQSMHGGAQGSKYSSSDYSSQQQQQSPLETCKPAVLQLLQLLTDSQPQSVSQLLTLNSKFLHDYLSSSPATATSWFGHFSVSGIQHFKHGARALANYALTNRSEIWQHLVWSGKHDQAPVAVAAKPHYFAELDVPATIKNLARYCPGFWHSDELLRSCDGGDWLRLNPDIVVQELHHILYDTQSPEHQQLLQLIDSYIQSADWQLLCNRLLLLLSDSQLMMFISLLAQQQQQQQQGACTSSREQQQQQGSRLYQRWCRNQAYNVRVGVHAKTSAGAGAAAAAALPADQLPCVTELPLLVLNAAAQQCSFGDLLLCNAVTCHRAQLLNIFRQAHDDDDVAQQLLRLVTIAECVAAKQQCFSAAAAAAAAHAHDKGEQQLLLLLSAWLLRLHLLLSCASGRVEGLQQILQQQQHWGAGWQVMMEEVQQQQQQEEEEQQQMQQARHIPVQQQQQQQQRQETAPQHENEKEYGFTESQQQQPEVAEAHRPLKRGLSRPKQRHKLHKKKHKVKLKCTHGRQEHEKSRKRRRSSSSSSSSDADDGDSQEFAPDDRHKAGRSKKQKHKQSKRQSKRRRQSIGSGSSSDWESLSDYDGGGELLDPADFTQHKTHNADRQQLTAQSTAAAAAVEAGSSGSTVKQQQQQQQQPLANIMDALGAFVVGGMLWSGPRWLLCLPARHAAAAGSAAATVGSTSSTPQQSSGTTAAAAAAASVAIASAVSGSRGGGIWVSGSAVDVVDAAAWYYFWLCQCNR